MPSLFSAHKGFWTPSRKRSIYLGVILLIISLMIQLTLGHYSARRALAAPYVSDLFLDNLPVVNLGFVIVAGEVTLWFFAWIFLILRPRYLLLGIKAIALFIISRAFFVSLTHLGPYPTHIPLGAANTGYRIYELFNFQGNYFYSGHTGFPFLLALIFWDNKVWRRIFLALTVIFGATMLLAHVHYSIDVFAAPFIVYGVFVITTKVFPEDYELLKP